MAVAVFGCSLPDQTSKHQRIVLHQQQQQYTSYRTLTFFSLALLSFICHCNLPFFYPHSICLFIFTFNFSFYYIFLISSLSFSFLIANRSHSLCVSIHSLTFSLCLCVCSLCRLCNHKLIVLQMVSTRQISPSSSSLTDSLGVACHPPFAVLPILYVNRSSVCLSVFESSTHTVSLSFSLTSRLMAN